jgi:hypothetical protein
MLIAASLQVRGLPVLEQPHLLGPFFTPMFLAIAWLVGSPRDAKTGTGNGRAHPDTTYLSAASVLLLAPLVLFGGIVARSVFHAGGIWPPARSGIPFGLVLGGLAVVAWCGLERTRRPEIASLLFIAFFGMFNAVTAGPAQPAHVYALGEECSFRRDVFDVVLEADEILTAFDPGSKARYRSPRVTEEHARFDGQSCGRGHCTHALYETPPGHPV